MLEGDSKGKGFAYPILTYNIGKRFDWDNPNTDVIFEMAGKYGYPYFANFINSDMSEDDVRSMCCRLRLDMTELRRRNGGLFGSGDNTGSVGVVTINMPRIGHKARSKRAFYKRLDKMLELAKESLEIKRQFIQTEILEGGLIPAYQTYVGKLSNHFSTIGIVGLNEMCENFLWSGITSDAGHAFAVEVEDYILERLKEFQIETGNPYNFEATPAESTAYRLALKDKKKYKKCVTQGTEDAPYYTNSCHIPVSQIHNLKQVFDNQEELQTKFTGGTVIHVYMDGAISGAQAKKIVRTVLENYKQPYISLSPITRYCPDHGYVDTTSNSCPKCGAELELYQRITGYTRPVKNFNAGKAQEFKDRKQLKRRDL